MKFPFMLLPRAVYEQMLDDKRLLQRAMKTIIRMKVHGSSIPRTPIVATRTKDVRDTLLEAIAENVHAKQRPAIRKALVRFMDEELRKIRAQDRAPSNEEVGDLRDRLANWHRRAVDTADEDDTNDGGAIDNELALVFDEHDPKDQALKANLTSGR